MPFEFATAARIIFARGAVADLPALTREFGQRILLVTGATGAHTADFRRKTSAELFTITGEPTVAQVESGAAFARESGAEVVVSIGGGSAIDSGKAIAAMATQGGPLLDHLEVIGKGLPLAQPPLPFIAVPTTAGTGAEVTRNAVLASPEHGVKVSLRHRWMLPAMALVDPELAVSCPPHVTAASGMDALTQCIEAYVSSRAQPMTDALCVEGIIRAVRSLERAVNRGDDLDAREDMALAALFSGIALANAGLGAVHGFAAPIGGRFHAPHGAVCAVLLAPVWETNWRAAAAAGDPSVCARFRRVAELLVGEPGAMPEAASVYLRDLTRRLHIPGLSSHGIRTGDFPAIAEAAARASSMKGNPVPLTPDQLLQILAAAF